MIIDYKDMVNAGLVKEAQTENEIKDKKFAIMLKLADGRSVGKFNITTKQDVENEIYAIKNNTEIPESLKKVAGYFIKQAAIYHDIETDIDGDIGNREFSLQDLEKTTQEEVVPVIKLGDFRYHLTNESQIKTAEEEFLLKQDSYNLKDRQTISSVIVKQAKYTKHIPNELLGRYLFPHLDMKKVAREIEIRKNRIKSDEYHKDLDKLAGCTDILEPLEFLDSLKSIDGFHGYNPLSYRQPYQNMLKVYA